MFDDPKQQSQSTSDDQSASRDSVVITPVDIALPPAECEDVVEYATCSILALHLRPGDAVRNSAVCVLLGLPATAHKNNKMRETWVRLVNGHHGCMGLLGRLAEGNLHVRPARAQLTVLDKEEASDFYRVRCTREVRHTIARDIRFSRTIRPNNAAESKKVNDNLARLGHLQQMMDGAEKRRKRREMLYAVPNPKGEKKSDAA